MQHRTAQADVSRHMDGDDGLEPKPFGHLEVPEAATRGPGMLVIDVRSLLPQPVLEYVELTRRHPALRLASEPICGDRISENLDSFMGVSECARREGRGHCAFNSVRPKALRQRADVNFCPTGRVGIVKACAFNDA